MADAGHADEEEHEALPKRVHLTPEVITALVVTMIPSRLNWSVT